MLTGRAIRAGMLLVAASLLFSRSGMRANAQEFSDYEVKAAYFYNFAKFVQWPDRDFADPAMPIRFCILQDHLFEAELSRITKGKSIAGHAVEVTLVENVDQSRRCHALFMNSVQQRQSRHFVETLRGSSVLTVGETEGFLQDGGMIAFVLEKDRVQFAVNRKAATQAGLYMSSKMLNLAKRVVN